MSAAEDPPAAAGLSTVVMGTGPFAVPTFAWLLESAHRVSALVTRPTPPPRGRRKTPVNPMRELADQQGLPVFDPPDVNAEAFHSTLRELAADVFVVCDYGQILSAEALGLAGKGGINLHGSLLPKYRGAAPVNWCLWEGDTKTGVTVIHMTPRLDAGPALVQQSTPIEPDEDAVALELRLSELGVAAVAEAMEMLAGWDDVSPLGVVQDAALATRAPRLKKADGQVDWTQPAARIANQVRALKPWPGTFTEFPGPKGNPLRLILTRAAAVDEPVGAGVEPGEVVADEKQQLRIATGHGLLDLLEVQPAGKRAMAIAEFLRGHPLTAGARLGATDGSRSAG